MPLDDMDNETFFDAISETEPEVAQIIPESCIESTENCFNTPIVSLNSFFRDFEAAKFAIENFALKNGFFVRIRKSEYKSIKQGCNVVKVVSKAIFVCRCEGAPISGKNNLQSNKLSQRCGCNWAVYLRRQELHNGCYKITRFIDEHKNHNPLSLELLKFVKRCIPAELKERLQRICDFEYQMSVADLFRLLPALFPDVPLDSSTFSKTDLYNYMDNYRRSRKRSLLSDPQALIDDLQACRDKDSDFFFNWKVDGMKV